MQNAKPTGSLRAEGRANETITASVASDAETARPAWHARTPEDVLNALKSTPQGLELPEAASRLAKYGRNALPEAAGKTVLQRLTAQFNNLLIYVLLASAVVAALLGHVVDTGVILGVVIINALIGFVQEGKAEQALEAIRGMISPKASVLREGRRLTIDAAEVVPGDILLLEAGDRVTADIRLTKARNLRIDEAILTGESVPVDKTTVPVIAEAALGDRRSMAFSGTLVTTGQGAGVVIATGPTSEIGRISVLLGRVEQLETPLIRQMNVFARQLTIAILALAAVTLAFAVFVRGYAAADAFMAMVGMAVAAIPEGLPAVMTITLAIGVQRMAARNAIIRRLPAVETLGSVSIICSDKTGTLTRNEMTVTTVVLAQRSYDVGGVGYEPKGGFSIDGREADPTTDAQLMRLARAALLCNDASLRKTSGDWVVEGDPMEGALVALGLKAGFEHQKLVKDLSRIDEIPFDAAHRYMATLHHGRDGLAFACVKGAPEQVLQMCTSQATLDGETALDKAFWLEAIEGLARRGQRVLALASRQVPANNRELTFADVEHGLTLDGLVGIIDPPRPEAMTAVTECHSAGIGVKMITGDHAATASAIAAELGLENPSKSTTGLELDGLDDAALRRTLAESNVFARTSPEHKLRLVEAMQADGAVIAMTGDGVNDAPALKRADVGVAMGRNGTEAAKEAADMVLADDNFASIVAAVREGRTVYDNLSKVIGWTLPTNGGETLIIAAAILFGLTLPVTPVQILWINMVTAVGLGLVLAFEPAEPDIMQRTPRAPDAPLLSGSLLWRIVLVSLLFAAGAFGIFAWAESRGLAHEQARTMVVNTIVVMEIFYLFSVRYLHGTSVTWQGMLGTPAVLIGVGSIVLLQFAFTYLPIMQRLFQTRSIAFGDGLVIVGVGIVLLGILEVEKRARRTLLARDWLGRKLHLR
jgi:magnesium-transporting ATPase (P-type)